jgi:uncharacterized protein YgbK (DUF1537 family)
MRGYGLARLLKEFSRLGIIADDLTGANDTGAQFAKCGLATVVSLDAIADERLFRAADVIVVNTDSRLSSPTEAYDRAKTAAEFLKAVGIRYLYKKVDSALRGNIGSEVDAAMDVFGFKVAFVVPAFPAHGRITLNGHQLLQSKPLCETEIAADPLSPVTESHIPTLLAAQSRRPVGHVDRRTVALGVSALRHTFDSLMSSGKELIVVDAVTDKDLNDISQAISELDCDSLSVGSAGLASELPSSLALVPHAPGTIRHMPHRGVIVVNGSMSRVAREQVEHAHRWLNLGIVRIDVDRILQMEEHDSKSIKEYVQEATTEIQKGYDIAVCLGAGSPTAQAMEQDEESAMEQTEISRRIAHYLGLVVAEILRLHSPLGLVLTGGDTALAVCNSLGASGIALSGEIMPGVPVGHLIDGRKPGLTVVTKAGSFGEADTISRAVRYLHGLAVRSTPAQLEG